VALLEGEDVEITSVGAGAEAMRQLETKSFDCMVLDLALPDMQGGELLEELHRRDDLAHVPVIVFTGKELTEAEKATLDRYAERIILKGARSCERLLDETTLFLHQVEKDLPEAKRRVIQMLHDKDAILRGKTVLLADDDMRNVFALSSVLEERGLKVEVAKTGRQCIQRLGDNGQVDLVLMDIMMPEMDGYEAMRQIRAEPRFAQLPIIALTAKAMKGDRGRCIQAGASDYLAKPVDTDKLLSMMRVWLYR
jgi:tubulin-specific chaperone A